MHFLVKRLVGPAPAMIAVLSGASLIVSSLSLQADPILRGPFLQEPVIASASQTDNGGPAGNVAVIRNDIVCVAGCYPDAGPQVTIAEGHSGAVTQEWMPVTEPDTSQPATRAFRRWYDRIGDPGAR